MNEKMVDIYSLRSRQHYNMENGKESLDSDRPELGYFLYSLLTESFIVIIVIIIISTLTMEKQILSEVK